MNVESSKKKIHAFLMNASDAIVHGIDIRDDDDDDDDDDTDEKTIISS
jgi:hypothetical protein